MLLCSMLIHNFSIKGLISQIAVIDVIKDVPYVQRSRLEILNKVCLTVVFVISKSDFLPDGVSHTYCYKMYGTVDFVFYKGCQSSIL